MDDIAISALGISKCYQVFDNQRARLRHALWPGSRTGMQEVWALRDIGFEVRRGESVGIIGRNGSGKSTLLEILTGTLAPTAGESRTAGRVSALLELGSGFNPEYTGRDNVLLNGLLLGLSRAQVHERFEEIADFAEIGPAIDRQVKTYSSGMLARLAFAVQVALEPDILIVDEALSVGDFFFQQKCLAHMLAMQRRGVTILFVSHDMGMVRNVCSRALYLRSGALVFAGPAERAAQLYFEEGAHRASSASAGAGLAARAGAAAPATVREYLWRSDAPPPGSSDPHIIGVDVQDASGKRATAFRIGDLARVLVDVAHPASGYVPAVMLKNALGQVVNVTRFGGDCGALASPRATFVFEVELNLEAGRYGLTAYVGRPSAPNVGPIVSESPALGPISIEWDYDKDEAPFHGMFGLPARVTGQSGG